MAVSISRLNITTIKRNQRYQGPTSSAQINALQDEVIIDFINIQKQWNNSLVPFLTGVPAGESDINAFTDGLSGGTLFVDPEAIDTSLDQNYYNTVKDRPNTILEQFQNLYQTITDQNIELTELVTTGTAGSSTTNVDTYTGTTTLTTENSLVLVNASSGSVIVNLLPAAACTGQEFDIIKMDSSGNGAVITPTGSELINGSASYSLTTQYQSTRIRSTGTGYVRI